MGVPDFLKFVARSSPAALCRLPKRTESEQLPPQRQQERERGSPHSATSALLEYDYVLVDATNAAQTIGLERVFEFLSDPRLVVHKAIVLAVDAGRTREGTARHHRQAHLMIGDLEVKVQQLCSSLNELFRKRAIAEARQAREANPTQGSQQRICVPYVVMSGRNVAGEADYKVLDLQRAIVTAALASGATSLPRFLFISEDSDILCGALCGPAPQHVSIATNLRDTMFELCILRLEHVLTYVAVCVDALVGSDGDGGAGDGDKPQATAAAPEPIRVDSKEASVAERTPDAREGDAALASKRHAEHVVRRKKQDGPMVAAGKRVALEDSSSDDEGDDGDGKGERAARASNPTARASTAHVTGGQGAAVPSAGAPAELGSAAAEARGVIPPFDLAAGKMVHGSCVDLVFLFVVVMGNGVNVPPLVRGATKVDIASCWRAYCKHKFSSQGVPGAGGLMTVEEQQMGRSLFSVAASPAAGGAKEDGNSARLSLNCRFLLSILESVHYADAQSRPPVEEEKHRALAYLSNAMYATLRFVVACNVTNGASLRETFLDSRPLAETEVLVPSLAAVLWVLSQETTQSFTYPLHGLARKELLDLQSLSAATPAPPALRLHNAAPRPESAVDRTFPGKDNRGSGTGGSASPSLVMCVGDALVCPPSVSATAASWAMARGGHGGAGSTGGGQTASRTLTLAYVMSTPNAISLSAGNAAPMRGGVGSGTASSTDSAATSIAALVKVYAQQHQEQSHGRRHLFVALWETWCRSVALAVPLMKAVARKSLFMSPVTGNVVEGPLAGTSGGDSKAALARGGGGASGRGASQASAATKLVYSFELRRMTPLLTGGGEEDQRAVAQDVVHSSREEARESQACGTAPLSSTQAALQAALGLSLDYAKAPALPKHVVVDPKELQLVKPMKREKKQTERGVAEAQPPVKAAKTEEEAEEGEKKKYRRPGKKERVRLRMEKKGQI